MRETDVVVRVSLVPETEVVSTRGDKPEETSRQNMKELTALPYMDIPLIQPPNERRRNHTSARAGRRGFAWIDTPFFFQSVRVAPHTGGLHPWQLQGGLRGQTPPSPTQASDLDIYNDNDNPNENDIDIDNDSDNVKNVENPEKFKIRVK